MNASASPNEERSGCYYSTTTLNLAADSIDIPHTWAYPMLCGDHWRPKLLQCGRYFGYRTYACGVPEAAGGLYLVRRIEQAEDIQTHMGNRTNHCI